MSVHKSTPKPQPTPKISSVFGPFMQAKSLFWNDKCQQMYFVDAPASEIHRYDPKTDEHVFARVGDKPLAFAIPIATIVNHFIIGFGTDLAELSWDGKTENIEELKVLKSIDAGSGCVISCGVVSPKGSLFVGTNSLEVDAGKGKGKGGIYQYKNGQLKKMLSDITIPNGMFFGLCGKRFFLIDSDTGTLDRFDYNPHTEELSNRQVHFDFKEHEIDSIPFGVMVDVEGQIWVTTCGEDVMIRIDGKEPKEVLRLRFESAQITSMCFAGSFLREMYVTTGRHNVDEVDLERFPKSGYFFRVTNLGSARGVACRAFCPDK